MILRNKNEKGYAMKQLPSDKYNVAWFKLAEFVARGEKERAMGLYRLLVHSFDDSAFAHQLEGDLLLSFDDTQAVEKYLEAAYLYEKQDRLIEAAAVYEHIVTIQSKNEKHLNKLISLHEKLSNADRVNDHVAKLAELLITNERYDELANQLQKIVTGLTDDKLLQQFLTKLQAIDGDLYQKATALLMQNS